VRPCPLPPPNPGVPGWHELGEATALTPRVYQADCQAATLQNERQSVFTDRTHAGGAACSNARRHWRIT